MSGRDIDHLSFGSLCVDAVDLNDAHRMTFEPEILRCESGHVDDAEHVCLSGFDIDVQVLSIVHQGGIRHWLSAGRVCITDKVSE